MSETRLLPTDELLRGVVDREVRMRAEQYEMMREIAELDRRGAAAELGYKNLQHVLRHAVRWDLHTAKQWIANAALLSSSITPTGSELAPELPVTAEAVAEGALSIEHVAVVAEVMKDLPAEHEATLVGYAREFEPRTVRDLGKKLIYALFRNDPEPRDAEPAPLVNQHVKRWRKDGIAPYPPLGRRRRHLRRERGPAMPPPHAHSPKQVESGNGERHPRVLRTGLVRSAAKTQTQSDPRRLIASPPQIVAMRSEPSAPYASGKR